MACALGLAALIGCGGNSKLFKGEGGHGASAGVSGATGGSAGAGGSSAAGGSGGRSATGGSGGTSAGGSAGSGTGEAGSGAGGEGPVLECPPDSPASAPLRRLSNAEYANTVVDLFGDPENPSLAPEPPGFDNSSLPITAVQVGAYHQFAHDLAERLTRDPAELAAQIDCDLNLQGEAACRQAVLGPFLTRVLRRPLDEEDAADFASVQAEGERLGGDFASGVRAVIEVALQDPDFLYRIEFGEPADDRGPDWARPTSYEMASRLSYLLWGSTPDGMLLDAAAADELRTDAAVEAQARRLLADARARTSLGRFYSILLPLSDAYYAAADTIEHPTFTADIARLLPAETLAFVTDLTFDSGGGFRELMTAPHSFLNAQLGAFYGVPGVTGDELHKVALDPKQRGGVLTQASIMAALASAGMTRPVQRGMLVLRNFLCIDIPPEPVGIPITPPDVAPEGATTRERYALHSADPACAGCHQMIDPPGFAFEHYDAAGLWRDTENGKPIDATGELLQTDAAGTFDGALELTQRIAASADAARCFQKNWFEFAAGRIATDADACSLSALEEAFTRSNGGLFELLIALTQTDAFRYRPRNEVAP